MQKIVTTEKVSLFISDDMFEEFERNKRRCVGHFDSFLQEIEPIKAEYIGLYKGKSGKIAVLIAHGDEVGGVWVYFDSDKTNPIQSWIGENESDFGIIILLSCNPTGLTPTSKKSLLVLPDRDFSILNLRMGEVTVSLIHPEAGELDYTLEYEVEKLRSKLKQKK